MKNLPICEGVLFDLDGTLLDSAPDLYAALCQQCVELGVATPDYALVRAVVSRGARGVLQQGFPDGDEAVIERLLPRFLEIYQQHLAQATRPFDGIERLLEQLDARELRWGIVTNKIGYLAEALIERLGWTDRIAALVAGDTLLVRKPDPAPVLHACELAGIRPERSVFVGDHAGDVVAGRAAGLYTVAVRWGYLDGQDPTRWGADVVLSHPNELSALLGLDEIVV